MLAIDVSWSYQRWLRILARGYTSAARLSFANSRSYLHQQDFCITSSFGSVLKMVLSMQLKTFARLCLRHYGHRHPLLGTLTLLESHSREANLGSKSDLYQQTSMSDPDIRQVEWVGYLRDYEEATALLLACHLITLWSLRDPWFSLSQSLCSINQYWPSFHSKSRNLKCDPLPTLESPSDWGAFREIP